MKHSVIALCGVAAVSANAFATISSTFDEGSEGWGTLNDAKDFAWDSGLGNAGGAIHAADLGLFSIWYFAGSQDYTGDLSSYYNGSITWDTLGIQGDQSLASRADVMIFGSSGLGIGINIPEMPVRGEWVTRSVDLAFGDWFLVGSAPDGALIPTLATEEQILSVLADVSGFYIQGEYTDGEDSTAIDNVFVTALVPSPGALATLALAGLAVRRRRSLR